MTTGIWSSVVWPIWSLCLFTAVGTAVLYAKLNSRKTQQKIYALTPILERWVPDEKVRYALEPLVFIVLGTAVGLFFGQPVNPAQAIAAGLGFTAAFSSG